MQETEGTMQQLVSGTVQHTASGRNVLLTVSGTIAPDAEARIASGERPQADYFELARAFNADLLDHAEARRSNGFIGRLLERIAGPHTALAWACFLRRRTYQLVVSDGEQVGMPLAILWRLSQVLGEQRPQHLMIAHNLAAPKKRLLFRLCGLQRQFERVFVYASWQKRFGEQRLGLQPTQVVQTPFMVDTHFFSPERVVAQPRTRPLICAVGLEHRDYATLMEAVRGLDADVVIAAASPWSKQRDTSRDQELPDNVTVRSFSQYELRQLYADCSLVVVPLAPVPFQAGVTTILEAMAMERAVICTRTPGQTDVVVEGKTGRYVPPSDPQALRRSIEELLAQPELAAQLGRAGRQRVEAEMSLEHYVKRLTSHVQEAQRTAPVQRQRSTPMLYPYGLGLGARLLMRGRVRQSLPYLIRPVNYWRALEYRLVLEHADFGPNDRILDIGSPKLLALYLAKKLGAEVFATDIDDYFVNKYRYVREMEHISPDRLHIAVRDGRALEFPDGSFDKVFSISVLEHIPDDGDSRCMQEIARVLTAGGRCCLTVPFWPSGRDEYIEPSKLYWSRHTNTVQDKVFFQRRYSEKDLWERLIRPSGLRLTALRYVGETVLTASDRELSDYLPALSGPVQPLLSRIFHTQPTNDWKQLTKPLCALIVLEKEPLC